MSDGSSPVPIYSWVGRDSELRTRPDLEPRPLGLESSALILRPPNLHNLTEAWNVIWFEPKPWIFVKLFVALRYGNRAKPSWQEEPLSTKFAKIIWWTHYHWLLILCTCCTIHISMIVFSLSFQIQILPYVCGVREGFIDNFLRLLDRKALALIKYVETQS